MWIKLLLSYKFVFLVELIYTTGCKIAEMETKIN